MTTAGGVVDSTWFSGGGPFGGILTLSFFPIGLTHFRPPPQTVFKKVCPGKAVDVSWQLSCCVIRT